MVIAFCVCAVYFPYVNAKRRINDGKAACDRISSAGSPGPGIVHTAYYCHIVRSLLLKRLLACVAGTARGSEVCVGGVALCKAENVMILMSQFSPNSQIFTIHIGPFRITAIGAILYYLGHF